MTLVGLQHRVCCVLVLIRTSAAVLECDAPPLQSRMENTDLKMADLETFNLNQ